MENNLLIIPATARLTKLINEDKITEPLRDAIHKKFPRKPDNSPSMAGYFITCPWCISIWAGSALTALSIISPKASKAVNTVLTASYVTGLMSNYGEPYLESKAGF